MRGKSVTLEGNEAVAAVAHALSEVIAIYPIPPSTPMGEHSGHRKSARWMGQVSLRLPLCWIAML